MIKPPVEKCLCCGYDYGTYLPRHCPDTNPRCDWFRCKECSAVCDKTGRSHYNDAGHQHATPEPTEPEEEEIG